MHACWIDAMEILPRLSIRCTGPPRARPHFRAVPCSWRITAERAIGPNVTQLKMTREGVCKAFGLSPELLEALN